MSKTKSAIIAPGGSLEHVRAAVAEGAHGVYVGPRMMSGRSGYAEMSLDDVAEARRITSAAGLNLYAAINRSIPIGEKDSWRRSLDRIARIAPDALIIGSFCVYTLVREMALPFPLHASTFMGIYNAPAALFARELGFCRIILNTSLYPDEMRNLIENAPGLSYELIAYGGICSNDNHRCNLPHGIRTRAKGEGDDDFSRESTFCQLRLSISDNEGRAISSGRLMCYPVLDVSEHLAAFIDMGISNFKIAGRERSADFVRKAIRSLKEGVARAESMEREAWPPLESAFPHPGRRRLD